ncbi:2Fe-2S iron-sulfur cluster-binding protein [Brevibacillus sp. SYP-B805]|uniref:2Fe-2S iron-sulfur cluster-binding protein n=1 Tax=Brevibacillus sp. SYP-B805 TaxID=1578199 RepID=UPI001F49441E|nr:2Fe-2S iron-sulfur cluster-binding protein [Brevibacillus sp. SYP-B805]
MLTLTSRKGTFQIEAVRDTTIVTLAKTHNIPWGYACERGICAQCRTRVVEGAECLNEVTEAEKLRLRKAERAEGYRLGCQIQVTAPGNITLVHSPY